MILWSLNLSFNKYFDYSNTYCKRNLCLHLIKTKLARQIKTRTIDESKFGIFKQLDYDVEYFSRVPTYKILNNNQPSKLGQNLKKKKLLFIL